MAKLEMAQATARKELDYAREREFWAQQQTHAWLRYSQSIGRAIYEHAREQSARPSGEVGQGVWNTAPETEL